MTGCSRLLRYSSTKINGSKRQIWLVGVFMFNYTRQWWLLVDKHTTNQLLILPKPMMVYVPGLMNPLISVSDYMMIYELPFVTEDYTYVAQQGLLPVAFACLPTPTHLTILQFLPQLSSELQGSEPLASTLALVGSSLCEWAGGQPYRTCWCPPVAVFDQSQWLYTR